MWNGTMFVDLDWRLNASSLLSASAELLVITSCAGSRAICPRPCTPLAAAQLQPVHALCLRLALGGGAETGVVYINYVVTWTANQKAAWWPWPLTFWLWKWCPCDMGYLCANFSLPRPLCSRLRPDVRDRQTSYVRQHHRLMPPPIRGGA